LKLFTPGQPLDGKLGVIAGRFAGPKAADRDTDLALAQLELAHEAPGRVDLRFADPAVGFGDVAHEFEGGSEELFGNRDRLRRIRVRRTPRLGRSAQAQAVLDQIADKGPHSGPPHGAGEQQADHTPKKSASPAHSR